MHSLLSVHSGIKSACSVLKYHDVQFEDAFMCAGASCTSDPPHVCRCSKVAGNSRATSMASSMWLLAWYVTMTTSIQL